ncbi:MAG: NADPH-dependent F420 reductase [Bacillota bacterium]
MDITIIGTGKMASGISSRLAEGGHNITFIGRSKAEADKLSEQVSSSGKKQAARSATFGSPIAGDVVILAVPFSAALQVIRDYKNELGGKILVDITNPFNKTYDGLVTPPNSSAAEEIAHELKQGAKVVKAFNTTFAGTLQKGEVGGQPLDVFVAGDDQDAKKTIMGLIEAGRMRPIDAGPLKRSRELEELALLSVTLQSTLGTNYMSSIKILS